MDNQNSETKKIIAAAGSCATIGATAVAGIAAVVSAPITLPAVLVGGAVGCIGGALLSARKK